MHFDRIEYPDHFRGNSGIGVTAPSSGLGTETYVKRFDIVSRQLEERGYRVYEGKCLRENFKHVSGSSIERANDFLDIWRNPEVGAIIPPWGGQLLIEILDKIDYEMLITGPAKWILGYSDTSTLLFAITIKTGIATAHGINFMDLIASQQDSLSREALKVLKSNRGDKFCQQSSNKYQKEFINFSDNIEGAYNLTEQTKWKSLGDAESVTFRGRMIGGCIDVLTHLVGTPYGDLRNFQEFSRSDGIIFYLENCGMSPCAMSRALYQMKLANWFDKVNGFIIGRTSAKSVDEQDELSHAVALKNCLDDLGVPIIYDADIGHKPPNMTIINGSVATLSFCGGKASLTQELV